MSTKQTGILGERIAENYLKGKGYQILDRNFVFRIPGSPQKGEIDIIVQKGDLISFIEVKTLIRRVYRGLTSVISPEERVDFAKQRKLRLAAESWLMAKRIPLNSKWQIDVIAIEIENGKPPHQSLDTARDGTGQAKISHFENAVSYC